MKQPSSWEEQESPFPPPTHPVFQGIREQEDRGGFSRPSSGSYWSNERKRRMGHRPSTARWDGSWGPYRGYDDEDEYEPEESSKIVVQVVAAALLVLVVFVAFQSSHPLAARAQQVVKNAMQAETDFSTVTTWFETHLGSGQIALPTVAKPAASTNGSKTTIEDQTFVDPLAGYKVVAEFNAVKHPALSLETTANAEVKTVSKGTVTAVDKNDKYGVYVIVDHGGTWGQTLYGHLESVSVKPGDWLYTGQTIGKTANQEKSDLYFAYITKDKQFADPRDLLKRVQR